MRFWSLVFLTIAALAVVAGFHDDGVGILLTRAVFGVALLLFAVSLMNGRRDGDRDGHHHP